MLRRLILLTLFVSSTICQTPVIGGTCKLGTADVQIGGKQTQFFLKCEATADSADGEGVWVVKSRAASGQAPAAAPVQSLPVENTQPQQHPKARKPASPNICEQDNGARENEACAVSATCLQAHNEFPSSYLQCDQTTLRWVRKSCQEGFLFNFEQQTCIVPKRMSSLSPSNSTMNYDSCSKCPLGTACRSGKCVSLTTSNLCSDGSQPNGTCLERSSQCPLGYFCTAQHVCCSTNALQSSIGCHLVCTISESCPSGMVCENNCCETRKVLRHPKSTSGYEEVDAEMEALKSLFVVDGNIFESQLVEALPTQPPILLEEIMEPSIRPTEHQLRSPSVSQKGCLSKNEVTPGFICDGTNANCTFDEECPTSFKCEKSCCRLAICPQANSPVRFTCRTHYNCRSNERCIFGACCPNIEKPLPNAIEMPSNTEYRGECEVDNRVTDCDLTNPCPETAECIDGVCCKLPALARCGNGLIALRIPQHCDLTADCPISSRCEYGKCCPDASDTRIEEQGNEETNQIVEFKSDVKPISEVKEFKKTDQLIDGFSLPKSKCLSSQKCDLQNLCPPTFTCSLSGKCCKLDVQCGDGTVPETLCKSSKDHDSCPSSSHKCTLLSTHYACCYSPEGQQANGLLCTFSSCSNSNPCAVGTCNNGYCCSSSSNAPPIIATCAGGFSSSLICALGSECPVGLHCDTALNLCCPLILPLTDVKNPKKRTTKRRRKQQSKENPSNTEDESENTRFSSYSSCRCLSGGAGGCNGCQNAPQVIALQNTCPGGGYSVGGCSSGYCATGYSCVQNQCCPSFAPGPKISVYSCPSGGSAVGACISGRCARGYQCYNNACCPQTTTSNPFVCPDGTQAVGGCVNGQCGTGYSCSNGLCCTGTSNTVKCLDGSDAVGACIPSCQGDGCGGVQVSYYCGSGYTCTTGNICCPINSCPNGGEPLGPTINGLCPTGYTVQGSLCCSALCSDGTSGIAAVNGACVSGYTYTNGVCCVSTTTTTTTSITCSDEISIGPCTGSGFNGGCQAGYACDDDNVNCCPVVDYTDESCQVGPAIDGACPPGYVVVYIPDSELISDGVNPGTCIDLQCTSGICDASEQSGPCDESTDTGTCPTGYTCYTTASVCCSSSSFRRLANRIRKGRPIATKPVYGRPLHSYMPPRFGGMGAASCVDGSISAGPCMNGLCGIGLQCQNGQCCQNSSPQSSGGMLQSKCPSGDVAVSGCFPDGSCGTGYECVSSLNLCCPPNQPIVNPMINNNLNNVDMNNRFIVPSSSPRPIGARCQMDNECVGQIEGLSMCHAGVCQCSPIAYSQGIACVRRKSFQMNDEPIIDGVDAKSPKETNAVSV